MSRAREFDEEVAVQRAMRLFWRKGYDTATLPDLLKSMRICRGSFYNAFGTKREVLVRAVRRYTESGMDGILSPLGEPDAARAQIEGAFAKLIEYTSSPKGRQGCLIGNSMTDLAMADPELRPLLMEARARTEDALTQAVERGQADGTIPRREDPRAIGRFLLNTISGLMVACKTQPGRQALEDIARLALRVLD